MAYEGRQPGPYQEHVILQKGGHLAFIYVNLMGAAMRSAVQGIVARVGHSVPIKGGEELIKRWSRALMARMTRGF